MGHLGLPVLNMGHSGLQAQLPMGSIWDIFGPSCTQYGTFRLLFVQYGSNKMRHSLVRYLKVIQRRGEQVGGFLQHPQRYSHNGMLTLVSSKYLL